MYITSAQDSTSPIHTPHGETICELIGRAVVQPTDTHSVAHVLIPPGSSTLLHSHPSTEESYYILKGKARMLLDDEEALLSPGQIVLIAPGQRHKIFTVGSDPLEMLVVCVPAWEPTNTIWLEGSDAVSK